MPFLGSKYKINYLGIFDWFFILSEKNNYYKTPCKISALTDKRFWRYGRFKRLKRGIFAVFWVKIQNQLSGHTWLYFFILSEKNNFYRTPCKISALTDKRFWSYGRFKRPKRGIFAVFWVKIQNQLSGHIWLDFFISSAKNNFSRTPCKISALTDKRFWKYGRSKRPKRGIFGVFLVKIQNQLSGHIWLDFFISSKKNIFSRTPCKILALTDKRFWSYGRSKWPKRGIFGGVFF